MNFDANLRRKKSKLFKLHMEMLDVCKCVFRFVAKIYITVLFSIAWEDENLIPSLSLQAVNQRQNFTGGCRENFRLAKQPQHAGILIILDVSLATTTFITCHLQEN